MSQNLIFMLQKSKTMSIQTYGINFKSIGAMQTSTKNHPITQEEGPFLRYIWAPLQTQIKLQFSNTSMMKNGTMQQKLRPKQKRHQSEGLIYSSQLVLSRRVTINFPSAQSTISSARLLCQILSTKKIPHYLRMRSKHTCTSYSQPQNSATQKEQYTQTLNLII